MLTWNFNKKPPWKNVQAVILAQSVCREWDWITQPFVILVMLSGEEYDKLKGMKDTGGNSSVLQVAFTKHVLIYIFWRSWAIIYLLCSCIPVRVFLYFSPHIIWDRYNDFKYVAFFQFQSGYSVFIGSCQLCLESIKILPVQSVIMGNPTTVRSSSINICDTEAGNCEKMI